MFYRRKSNGQHRCVTLLYGIPVGSFYCVMHEEIGCMSFEQFFVDHLEARVSLMIFLDDFPTVFKEQAIAL